jgi:hypothetical protein
MREATQSEKNWSEDIYTKAANDKKTTIETIKGIVL